MTKRKQKAESMSAPQSQRAGAVADLALDGMREHIVRLTEWLRVKDDDSKAMTLGNLGFKAAQIGGEARKRENDEAKAVATPREIIDACRRLAPNERAHVRRELAQMDSGGSVLSS